MITLLTNDSPRSYELMATLDEAEITYELKPTQRYDAPILIINNKELNFTKAQRWIRKRGDRSGDFI